MRIYYTKVLTIVSAVVYGVGMKKIKCHCGELAEVRWIQPASANLAQSKHELCCNCMSKIWEEINLKYHDSKSQQESIFEEIRQ